MTVTRDRTADAMEATSGAYLDGQQAYWRAAARSVPAGAEAPAAWLSGWDAAALEAARTLLEHGPALRAMTTLNRTLDAAEAAINVLTPAKSTPRQRTVSADALQTITLARRALRGPARTPS